MSKVLETTAPRKPLKAYRAILREETGTVTKLAGEILFFNDVTGAIVTVEPEDCVWLCVLGEVGLAATQAVMDRLHGNAPRICTTRRMEVQ